MIMLDEKGIETLIPEGVWKLMNPNQRARYTPKTGETELEVRQVKSANAPDVQKKTIQAVRVAEKDDYEEFLKWKESQKPVDDITGNPVKTVPLSEPFQDELIPEKPISKPINKGGRPKRKK